VKSEKRQTWLILRRERPMLFRVSGSETAAPKSGHARGNPLLVRIHRGKMQWATMVDVERQIEYWRQGSAEDWEVAVKLVEDGKGRHGLFFAPGPGEDIEGTRLSPNARCAASDTQPYPPQRIGWPEAR